MAEEATGEELLKLQLAAMGGFHCLDGEREIRDGVDFHPAFFFFHS